MFISDAYAQAGAAPDPTTAMIMNIAPLVLIVIVFYFLLIRPQQQARKRHVEMLGALKKGDVVETAGGLIGKIKSVAEDELRIELAPNIDVRVARHAVASLRSKPDPAPANDSKPA